MSSVTSIEDRRVVTGRAVEESTSARHVGASDLIDVMDDHTRGLLDRGRNARRAWLVPRSLLVADLAGLSLAYLLATLVSSGDGALGSSKEMLVFALTLPGWAIVAKLHGLYERDQERADNSTADDVVGVFHIVTIGVWLLLVASRLAGGRARGSTA